MTTPQHPLPNPPRRPTGVDGWERAEGGVLAVCFLPAASPVGVTPEASPSQCRPATAMAKALEGHQGKSHGAGRQPGTGGLAPSLFPFLLHSL